MKSKLSSSVLSRSVAIIGMTSALWLVAAQFSPASAQMGNAPAAEKMFDRIKATPEQREKLLAIMENARAQKSDQVQAREQNRKAMATALSAASIDRGAIEKLRSAQITQADFSSKKRTETMIAIAEVLTPEQRQQMQQQMMRRHGGKGDGPKPHGRRGERIGQFGEANLFNLGG